MWKSTATRSRKRRPATLPLAYALVLAAAVLGAYTVGRAHSPAGIGPEDRESVALYAEALKVVREDYVDQKAVDPRKQTYGAIEGMLGSLGDEGHTRFMTPHEVEQNRKGLSGSYVGIGVTLEGEGEEVVVSSPVEDSPAEEAGVESGDTLVAVDGESVRGKDVEKVASKVRGPEGSTVEITVLHGGERRVFSLERAELTVPVTSWAIIPGSDVAHVQLTSFSDDSAGELLEAFEEAGRAGAERFVLDLRDNPGGMLDQAVEIAGHFLPAESVVYLRREASGEREEVKTSGEPAFPDAPLVVLVNEGSASSAEILAGALRDNDRATLVGTTTYGTGTVLSEYTLSDGSAVLLGIAEWLTPNGDFIRESGIEPEITVRLEDGEEPLAPDDVRQLSGEESLEQDPQLRRAFETVTSGRRQS